MLYALSPGKNTFVCVVCLSSNAQISLLFLFYCAYIFQVVIVVIFCLLPTAYYYYYNCAALEEVFQPLTTKILHPFDLLLV